MKADSYAVWNRATAMVALATGEDRLQLFRRFDAECDALGLTREARDAAVECLRLRARIETGDGGAVLDAIGHCALHRLMIPEWLADEYLRRHGNVGRGFARDWNDPRAFGNAYPKGTNIAGIRAQVEDAPAAYAFAAGLLAADPARPFDAGFYEEIGKHIGVGKTRAQELLSMALKDNISLPPLAELRKKLASGLTRAEAVREWNNEQFEPRMAKFCREQGWTETAAVWRKSDPGK